MFSNVEGARKMAWGLRWDLVRAGLYPPLRGSFDAGEEGLRRSVVAALEGLSQRDLLGLWFVIDALKVTPVDVGFLEFYQ